MGRYIEGGFFIDTWIEKDNTPVSEVNRGDTEIFHIIRVQNGSRLPRNVKVFGSLPQGNDRLVFDSPQGDKWESTLTSLISESDAKNRVDILANAFSGEERVHCSSVEYQNYWNPDFWKVCQQNLPLEITVRVV